MENKKFYDYEEEGGTGLMFPRNHFRNSLPLSNFIPFPLEGEEISRFNDYNRPGDSPYDVYKNPETDSYIWVIGGDAHCHEGEELGKYDEGVVMYCEAKHKEDLIKKIKGVV